MIYNFANDNTLSFIHANTDVLKPISSGSWVGPLLIKPPSYMTMEVWIFSSWTYYYKNWNYLSAKIYSYNLLI